MKYLTALLAMVKVMFLGCGETKEITTKVITTKDIIKRVNSTGIITDEQAESLSKWPGTQEFGPRGLVLNGLTSITNEQAESLSKVESLDLNGLTSITDEQAEILSKVPNFSFTR